MVGGVAEINGSQQLPRPAVLVPCACVSAAQAETLRYRCSLCALTLHRGANRLQKMTKTSVKASIFSAPVSVWLPFAATFHVTQASGVAGKRRGGSVQQFVSPLHSCANPPLESLFFLPPPYKVTDTHFAAVFEISTRWPRGQLDPKSTFIERRPPHPPAVVTFFRSCCHIRMLTLCLEASRDLLGCKKKATWLMTRSVISTGKSCTDPGFTSPADVMFSRCVPVDCLPSELAQSPLLPRRQEDGITKY